MTSTDFAHNGPAAEQRRAKATELARQLYAHLTPELRRQLERDAQQRRASDETWAMAVQLVGIRMGWDLRHPELAPLLAAAESGELPQGQIAFTDELGGRTHAQVHP